MVGQSTEPKDNGSARTRLLPNAGDGKFLCSTQRHVGKVRDLGGDRQEKKSAGSVPSLAAGAERVLIDRARSQANGHLDGREGRLWLNGWRYFSSLCGDGKGEGGGRLGASQDLESASHLLFSPQRPSLEDPGSPRDEFAKRRISLIMSSRVWICWGRISVMPAGRELSPLYIVPAMGLLLQTFRLVRAY